MKSSAPQRSQNTVRQRVKLRISPTAAACSALLFAMGTTYAQDATTLDTVTVTGIRRGIESSIAAKKNSDSIVEVVSSEDIGKLPDSSIAESIARLPGVTAQRGESGRPSSISIRGLGPDYATTLMNGREMVSSGLGRSAEYDQFPSELVGQVIVYKSPDAALVNQGLSGTVDIRPVMPLSFKGEQKSVSVRGEVNSNGGLVANGPGAVGNRISASYINQYADGTIGLALGFAHLDSPAQEKSYGSWGYLSNKHSVSAPPAWAEQKVTYNSSIPDNAVVPSGGDMKVTSGSQVRDGFMAVLEFKPNRDFHSVVDLYYSKFTQDRELNRWTVTNDGAWNDPGTRLTNPTVSTVNGIPVVTSGTLTVGPSIDAGGWTWNANRNALIDQQNFHRTDDTKAVGWKNEFKFNSKWSGTADVAYSKALHDETYIETVSKNIPVNTVTFSGMGGTTVPVWTVPVDLSNRSQVLLTSSDPNWPQIQIRHFDDEAKSLRLATKYDLEGLFSSVEAGLNYSQRDKSLDGTSAKLILAHDNIPIPDSIYRGTVNILGTNVVSWNALAAVNQGLYKTVLKDFNNGPANDYAVREKITTAFAKLNIDTDLGAVPLRGNVGVQMVHAQQEGEGIAYKQVGGMTQAQCSGIYLPHRDLLDLGSGPACLSPISGGTSYTDFLPSLNLNFSLKPDLIARVGLSKAMARPNMADMRAGIDNIYLKPYIPPNATAPIDNRGIWTINGAVGNPALQPWRAKAIDFSLEKYFGKGSYVAGAVFYKALDNFIYDKTSTRDLTGYNDGSGLTPICDPIGSPANCNPGLVQVTTKANGTGGKVWGLELSASLEASLLTPVLDGFGVIASESVTRNKLPMQSDGITPIQLPGFSGIVNNLTLYYEKNGFSTRISQRYRAAFDGLTRDVMLRPTIRHTLAEKQVDFQIGYSFEQGSFKGLALTLSVNNLTDQPAVSLNSSPNDYKGLALESYSSYGRTYLMGASYKF
ncbi:MAG: TonB-dependent receptor [Betaproteobacteria bacterium]